MITCIGGYSDQVGLQRMACNSVHLGHLLLPSGQQGLQGDQLLNSAIVGVPAQRIYVNAGTLHGFVYMLLSVW